MRIRIPKFDAYDSILKGNKKARVSKPVVFTESFPEVITHEAIATANGGIICYGESAYQTLVGLIGSTTLFLDLETTSGDAKKDSKNPWRNCWICGIAICSNDSHIPYYIPVNSQNEHKIYKLLFEIFSHRNLKTWINHNIKYDVHVLANSAGIIVSDDLKLVDTLTLSKLIDSDRFKFGLDALSKDWLNEDISQYEDALRPYLYNGKNTFNKDYGRIPVDIIGPYAIQDIITNKKLYQYIEKNLPADCNNVKDTEIALTSILVEMERDGLQIDAKQLKETQIQNYANLIQIEEELEKLVGRSFRPHTNSDCFDILCNYFGLPVLRWTQEDEEGNKTVGNPSFDKYALTAYSVHPLVNSNEKIKSVVNGIIAYRQLNTFNGLFVEKFLEQHINGIMHPFYNQCIRTGRLSCKEPNAQQMSKDAKELILPYDAITADNNRLVSYDFSQIEFRTIAHYSESKKLVEAYNANPDTDFHSLTGKVCGISRQLAKTMNFLLGFGGGKKKTLKALASSSDLVANILLQVKALEIEPDKQEAAFERLAENHAADTFNTFHREMPEIKRVGKEAELVCKSRGYVYNMFGRQRHLKYDRAHTAFNFLNQSTAADIFKERIVFISKMLREVDDCKIKIVANVHDELLFCMPKELAEDKRIIDTLGYLLENPKFPEGKKFLVPIRVSRGVSKVASNIKTRRGLNNWKEASASAKLEKYDSVVDVDEFQKIIR